MDSQDPNLISKNLSPPTRSSSSPIAQDASSSHAPALPPHLTTPKPTADEIIADIKRSPLFMTDIDPSSAQDNDELAAFQALAYEGTPLENATDFKERGNEVFKARRWGDAKEYYGKGITLLVGVERERRMGKKEARRMMGGGGGGGDGNDDEKLGKMTEAEMEWEKMTPEQREEEVEKERQMLATLHLNRAACQLELKNHRSCWLDCAACLRLLPLQVLGQPSGPQSTLPSSPSTESTETHTVTPTISTLPISAIKITATKAYFRSSRALLLAGRILEAHDALQHGLAIDPSNASLLSLRADIDTALTKHTARQNAEREKNGRMKRREVLLKTALKARGWKVRETTDEPPDIPGDARLKLDPDEDSPSSQVVVPVLLLYPLAMESDFIQAFRETDTLGDHLAYILPLPWDSSKGEYGGGDGKSVEVFAETGTGGLAKVGFRVSLLEVLGGGKVEIVDGVVKMFVLPKGKSEGWIAEWKRQRGKK